MGEWLHEFRGGYRILLSCFFCCWFGWELLRKKASQWLISHVVRISCRGYVRGVHHQWVTWRRSEDLRLGAAHYFLGKSGHPQPLSLRVFIAPRGQGS